MLTARDLGSKKNRRFKGPGDRGGIHRPTIDRLVQRLPRRRAGSGRAPVRQTRRGRGAGAPRGCYGRRDCTYPDPRTVGCARLGRRLGRTGHRAVRLGLQPGPEVDCPVLAAVRDRLRDAAGGCDPVGFALTVAGGLGADRRCVDRRGRSSRQRAAGPARRRRQRGPRTTAPARRQGRHRPDRRGDPVDRVGILFGPGGQPGLWRWTGFIVAVLVAGAAATIAYRDPSSRMFCLTTILIVALDLVFFALSGTRL